MKEKCNNRFHIFSELIYRHFPGVDQTPEDVEICRRPARCRVSELGIYLLEGILPCTPVQDESFEGILRLAGNPGSPGAFYRTGRPAPAHITPAAIRRVFLPEIVQQIPRAAGILFPDILQHCLHPFVRGLLQHLVPLRRQPDIALGKPLPGVL